MKKNKFYFVLLFLLFHLFVSLYVFKNSKIVRVYDEADRIEEGIQFSKYIENKNIKGIKELFTTLYGASHPHFYSLVEGIVLFFLKKLGIVNIDLMILITNFLFLIILTLSVYCLGKTLYHKNVGILSSIIVIFLPLIFSHTRIVMLDLPLTSMLSLGFFFLIKTKNFSSLFFSILSALIFSLAQFTKETAVIFIIPFCFLYFLFILYQDSKTFNRKRIINIFVFIFLLSLITIPIFLKPIVLGIYWGKAFVIKNHPSFFYYLKCIMPFYIGPLLFPFVFFIIFIFFFKTKEKKDKFLCFYCLFIFLIFNLSSNKSCRFLMPLLPFLSLMLARSIEFINIGYRKFLRKGLISILILQYLILNFFPFIYHFFNLSCEVDSLTIGIFSSYYDENFQIVKQLLDFFKKEDKRYKVNNEIGKMILFTFDEGWHSDLNWRLQLEDLNFWINNPQQADIVDFAFIDKDWEKYVLRADYIVDREKEKENVPLIEKLLKKYLKENMDLFEKIEEFNFQNEKIIIYRKK